MAYPSAPVYDSNYKYTNIQCATNVADLAAAQPLIFAQPVPVQRQKSGAFVIHMSGCPYPSGQPVTITTHLYRDAIQLPPARITIPVGSGDHIETTINFIDYVSDSLPHTYSVQFSSTTDNLADSAGHLQLVVFEM